MFKLLIVDDEQEIADSLENLIKEKCKYNLEIKKAYLPREAIQIAVNQKFDVILSDMRMPGLTGLQMTEEILKQEKNKNAKIIFLTGYSDFENLYKVNKSTDAKYILKNEEDEVIIETIEKVIDEMPVDQFISRVEVMESTSRTIQGCKQYIYENLNKDLGLQEIAQKVNMNPSYLSRLFKKECNENLSHYIQRVKIKKAKKLIQEDKLKIMDIGKELGFYYPANFTTYFKRHTGYTPQQYREAYMAREIDKK